MDTVRGAPVGSALLGLRPPRWTAFVARIPRVSNPYDHFHPSASRAYYGPPVTGTRGSAPARSGNVTRIRRTNVRLRLQCPIFSGAVLRVDAYPPAVPRTEAALPRDDPLLPTWRLLRNVR